MKKKILAIFLAVMMLVALLPLGVLAADGPGPEPIDNPPVVQPITENELREIVHEYAESGLDFPNIVEPKEGDDIWKVLYSWETDFVEKYRDKGVYNCQFLKKDNDVNKLYLSIGCGTEMHTFADEVIEVSYAKEVDQNILKKVNQIIDTTYKKSMGGYGKGFRLDDIDLIKYILDGNKPGEFYDYTRKYSSEYRKATANANFNLKEIKTGGAGGGASFFFVNDTESAQFLYKDVLYRYADSNLVTGRILYVPANTTDATEAIVAAKKRIKDATGADVKIEKKYSSLHEFFNAELNYSQGYEFWEENAKAFVKNWDKLLDACFEVTINNNEKYLFLISSDEQLMSDTELTTSDIATDISITTDDNSVSKDAQIAVEEVSEEESAELLKKIGLKDGDSYDISIGNEKGNISKLENGKFLVSIPVSEELEGKTLSAYYVAKDGTVEEHPATVKDGFATFETDHFSTYTLGEANKVPKTADEQNEALWLMLLVLSLSSVAFITRKFSYIK